MTMANHEEADTQYGASLPSEPGKMGMAQNAATETQPAPNISTQR
jgi:hypothetical protein